MLSDLRAGPLVTAGARGAGSGTLRPGKVLPTLGAGSSAADQPPTSSLTHGPRGSPKSRARLRSSLPVLGQCREADSAGITLPIL